MFEVLFRLLIAHAVTDFALQNSWMVDAKLRAMPSTGDVAKWYIVLLMHALICGAGVYWATGSVALGIVETFVHWLIDFAKCDGWTNPNDDQVAHICCRIVYWLVMVLLWMNIKT